MLANNINFATGRAAAAGLAVAFAALALAPTTAAASPYDAYKPFYEDMIGYQGVRRPSKAEFYAAHPWAATRSVEQIMAASPFQKTRFYGYSYETNLCMLTYSRVRFDNGAVRRVPMDRCGWVMR